EQEQVMHFLNKFFRLGKFIDVTNQPGVLAGQGAKLRNEVRIGEKAHVEDQVGLLRNAIFISEADGGNQQVSLLALRLKKSSDVGAQFMNIEVGGVDREVGEVPQRLQQLAFGMDGSANGVNTT